MRKCLAFIATLLLFLVACGGRTAEEPLDGYDISVSATETEPPDENRYDYPEPKYTTEPDQPAELADPEEPVEIPYLLQGFTQGEFDRLPAWLSVGLDLYLFGANGADMDCGIEAARRMADEGLPGFGDAWFIPGFVPAAQPGEAEAVALAFVRHISAAGALRDFIGKHTHVRYTDDAIAAAVYHWTDFAGTAESGDFSISYERGRVQRVEGSPRSPFSIVLSVRGNYAVYHFGHERDETPEQWTPDMVSHHVAIGEESIRFVSDWLGYEPDRRFSVLMIHIDATYGFGGGYGDRQITNFQGISDPPWAMAHEAVHGLLSSARIQNNFPRVYQPIPGFPGNFSFLPYFEEGMCIMLELLFEIATENERFALEAAGRRRHFWRSQDEWGNEETRLTLECALLYINNRALSELEYLYEPGNTARFGTRYTVLNMHHTAASFMFYLYTERGTRADLLRAYQNINLMYEIYGADMEGMIASWLVWLDGWRLRA